MDEKDLIELEKKNKKLKEEYEKIESKRIKKNQYDEYMAPIREKRKIKREEHRIINNPPVRSLLEEIGNSVTHGVGFLLATAGFIILLVNSDTGLKIMASVFYGISMMLMMLMSCLYHSFKSGSRVKRLWRRFDYCGIHLLIGGTFAPIYLVYVTQTINLALGIVLFCVQWGLIITGITFISIFGPGRVKKLNFILFFAIGWSGIMFIPSFIKNNLNLLYMILGGGLVYTLGMIPFAKKGSKCAHFIWHFFVIAGASVQYFGILFFLY